MNDMRLVITIVRRDQGEEYMSLFKRQGVSTVFTGLCRGTASKSMLDYLGIERKRTRVEWVSAAEGAKFAATMNDFAAQINELGPNRRLEDLRCRQN